MRQEGNLFLDPFTFFALFTATRYPAVVKSFIVYLSLAISILFVTACQVVPLTGSSSTSPSAQPMSATEFPSLDDFYEAPETVSRTIFTAVKEEAMIDKILAATQRITGDLNNEKTGVMLVLPVLKAYGIDKQGKSK